MKKRFIDITVIGLAAIIFLGSGFYWGFYTGQNNPKVITVEEVKNLEEGKPSQVDFGLFWQVWDILSKDYLRHDELATTDQVYGAVRGLVQATKDPYTEFFPPEASKRFEEDVQGNFGGIGAEVGLRQGRLTIIAPLKDSPAEKAGLLAGDFVVRINSTSTQDLQLDEAINIIRGPVGSTVTLSIFREGWEEIKDVAIKRNTIVVPTLEVERKEGNILYVQLYSFNANSSRLFYETLSKELSGQGIGGLVLDLRNNPGGYLEVAVDLAGWFLDRGQVVVKEEGLEKKNDFLAQGNGALKEVPLVILINKGSASASEILAGAIKDHNKVPLVGEQSYGKGTVQELRALSDGSSLKITIAHWVLPSGKIIEGNGLTPDYEVKLSGNEKEGEDPQLKKALEILKPKIKTIYKSS